MFSVIATGSIFLVFLRMGTGRGGTPDFGLDDFVLLMRGGLELIFLLVNCPAFLGSTVN